MTTQELFKQAQRYGACARLTGQETAAELMNLVFTPHGIEFCTKYNFPTLPVFRTYKSDLAHRHHIYIDSRVELSNVDRVLLVGNTEAVLTYDDPTCSHQVILMHGAKAKIKATGYAVVFVTNAGGEVETDAQDNAKIL